MVTVGVLFVCFICCVVVLFIYWGEKRQILTICCFGKWLQNYKRVVKRKERKIVSEKEGCRGTKNKDQMEKALSRLESK